MFFGIDSLMGIAVLIGAQSIVPSIGNIAADWLVRFLGFSNRRLEAKRVEQAKVNQFNHFTHYRQRVFFREIFAGVMGIVQLFEVDVGPTFHPMVRGEEKQVLESHLVAGAYPINIFFLMIILAVKKMHN